MDARKISNEEIEAFLNGHDEMEHIVSIESDYMSDKVSIIYVDKNGTKRIKKDDFKPFVWAKHSAVTRLFNGDKAKLKASLYHYGLWIKALDTSCVYGKNERMENGYKYMVYAKKPTSYSRFLQFFKDGGVPIYPSKNDKTNNGDPSKEYVRVTPVEQYMISTGKRMFKGYNSYDELKRFIFDLETQGLNPKIHRIEQIGIRTNKGFEKIITVTKDEDELPAIEEFIRILSKESPDIAVGHNSENFDWQFIITRCEMHGTTLADISQKYMREPIYKKNKESVLKLGGEVEYYYPTIIWGHNVLDSLHAARRAQAVDSNMKSSNLKYVTQYLNMKKTNRVYVQGDKITSTWADTNENYDFNEENGEWHKITEANPFDETHKRVSGKYIVERYLLDDLWETDKIEEKLNETNFLIGKWLPTTFTRACTMGTAGIWKLIMLAWSYENDLAVPSLGTNRRFVGGLSRLISTGYKKDIVKLDFNSLYPATILTWNIQNSVDGSGILNRLLEYILTTRELYKGLKKDYGKKAEEATNDDDRQHWKAEASLADKKQSQVKVLANSYFGSAGSPIFNWSDDMAAEQTTCTGRMCLRLMISHFKGLGYEPVVGDSFTGDTPLFIKYNDTGYIDIKPIDELIGETEVDALGREYDTSEKPFKVLCRSGWMEPQYIYRHKTDKPLYEVSEGNMSVTVTEDHSLFTDKQEKIKPSEISNETKLEYYTKPIVDNKNVIEVTKTQAKHFARWLMDGTLNRVPLSMLNTSNKEAINIFLEGIKDIDLSKVSKTCRASINFLKNRLRIDEK